MLKPLKNKAFLSILSVLRNKQKFASLDTKSQKAIENKIKFVISFFLKYMINFIFSKSYTLGTTFSSIL